MSASVEAVSSPCLLIAVESDRRPSARLRVAAVAAAAVVLGFVVSPYVTLCRIGLALRHDDVATLATLVDWDSVRLGLRDEIAPGGVAVRDASATVATAPANDDLPDFGSSFASDAVSNALDTAITPAHVGAMLQAAGGSGRSWLAEAAALVRATSFHGLRHLDVAMPKDGPGDNAIRIRLDYDALHGWRVRRVLLPPAMLDEQSRT